RNDRLRDPGSARRRLLERGLIAPGRPDGRRREDRIGRQRLERLRSGRGFGERGGASGARASQTGERPRRGSPGERRYAGGIPRVRERGSELGGAREALIRILGEGLPEDGDDGRGKPLRRRPLERGRLLQLLQEDDERRLPAERQAAGEQLEGD